MTPTMFMTYLMAVDPWKTVVVTWTPVKMHSMMQQGSQPLCCYLLHAISHQTKVVNKSTVQIWEKKATQKFAKKYRDILQNNMAEGPKDPQGPFFYQEGGKTYTSLLMEMLQNIQRSLLFEKMQKDCKAEGIKIPKTIMAKDPVTHVLTPQEYLQKVEAGTMPPMDNHQMMKELAENATVNDQTKFMMMEFRDVERPVLTTTSKPQKRK